MKLRWPQEKLKNLKPQTIHRLFWLSLAAMAIGIFIKLTWELKEDSELNSLDEFVLTWVSHHRMDWLNGPAVDITALGSPSVSTLLSVFSMIILILFRHQIAAIHLLIASIGAGLLTSAFKHLIGRVRPTLINPLVEVTGYSYPSGHSLGAAAIYMTLAILAIRLLPGLVSKLILVVITLIVISLVGFSRVYLGVHYPSDVLSGIFLGIGWALLLTSYFSSRYQHRSQ